MSPKEIPETVERVLASMQDKERTVIRTLMDGHTQLEVSRSTGIPQPLISYYVKSFRAKMANASGMTAAGLHP